MARVKCTHCQRQYWAVWDVLSGLPCGTFSALQAELLHGLLISPASPPFINHFPMQAPTH